MKLAEASTNGPKDYRCSWSCKVLTHLTAFMLSVSFRASHWRAIQMAYTKGTPCICYMLLHFFMRRLAAAAINSPIALKSKSHRRQKDGKVTFYCETVSYLLEKFASDDVMAETYMDMMWFTQLSNKLPTEYAEARWKVVPQWHCVYEKFILNESLLDSWSASITAGGCTGAPSEMQMLHDLSTARETVN